MAGAMKKLLYYLLLLCLCSHSLVSQGNKNNSSADELVLLSVKSMLSSGPSSSLASWNTSRNLCSWPGVACGRRHPDRVVALRMGSFNLSGSISPLLGNLSFLRELDLRGNQLVGGIPLELGKLGKLQVLNLSMNHLDGSIPATLGGCTQLRKVDLSANKLQGEIPKEIGSLKNLLLLRLENNGLSGGMPRFWSNLTGMVYLDLSSNLLSGHIPSSLGMLPRLSFLDLGQNNLSGSIPTSFWNMTSLMHCNVQINMLSGKIPSNAFDSVPRLQGLLMDNNHFHGPIPASIANASDLRKLQLGINFFGGIIPPEVGSLRNLNWLHLGRNSFQAKEPKDWGFLTALTNSSQLQLLMLAFNKFGGVLPNSFSNLSTSLEVVSLVHNRISGSIPAGIGNLVNLQLLDLSINLFTGHVPSSLCTLQNLGMLYLYSNNISGPIPLALGNLTRLINLYLEENDFSGTIPATLGNLTTLLELSLSDNYLAGPIPSEIFSIRTLSRGLDLSNNNLVGPLPQEIGNLQNIIAFYAGSNNLSGEIPTTIGKCQLLQYLFLDNNSLSGTIPLPLSQLRSLENVDLSANKLSGQIPEALGNLATLSYLNLSFNNFVGEVPNFGVFANITAISIQGNGKLCGGIPDLHLPTCSLPLSKRKRNKFPVIPVVTSLVAALLILPLLCKLLIWHNKRKETPPSTHTHSIQGHLMISYSELVRATDGFSESNLLGSGSFGSVYKAELDGHEGERTGSVAVKVLKLQTPKALKSFTAECEVLRNLRHRNLVKIITVCSSVDTGGNDFRAIIYKYMPNGSLESWLHPSTTDQAEQRYLNLFERVTILLDVAYALDYLHCCGPEPIVHCDLKSSNVLLDSDMVAHVGDFGLAKTLVEGTSPLQQSTSSSMGLRGTIGYAAPEYGAGNPVSANGDIYSYGILVLETITGRRPTDNRFTQGLSLREYTDMALHNRKTMDAMDTRLSLDLKNELHIMGDASYKSKMDCVVSLLRLGMCCSHDMPSSRMPTGGIIKELIAIKDSLLSSVSEHRT